jgi:glyoxylate carboligase
MPISWSAMMTRPELIVSDAKAAIELFVAVAREWRKAGLLRERQAWSAACQDRKRTMLRRGDFDEMPIKPQRVYHEMNRAFGRDTCYVSVIGLSQIAGAQFSRRLPPTQLDQCGGRPVLWDGRCPQHSACARPIRTARSWHCRAITIFSS